MNGWMDGLQQLVLSKCSYYSMFILSRLSCTRHFAKIEFILSAKAMSVQKDIAIYLQNIFHSRLLK